MPGRRAGPSALVSVRSAAAGSPQNRDDEIFPVLKHCPSVIAMECGSWPHDDPIENALLQERFVVRREHFGGFITTVAGRFGSFLAITPRSAEEGALF